MSPPGPKPVAPSVRFWRKVDKDGPDGCWLWRAYIGAGGYGSFGLRYGKSVSAHRFAYEDVVGAIPDGLDLDHLCRVRHCVNPAHLEPVTRAENLRRGVGVGGFRQGSAPRFQREKTHCPHGHPYDEENTRIYFYGRTNSWHRACRTCHRERTRARRFE